MDFKQIAKATAKVITSYLTYQAVRVVINQLNETNPPLAFWLQNFSATANIQDGEAYLQALLQANQELALRIMTVREHMAHEVIDFLPELVQTSLQQANTEHRRQLLERMTQIQVSEPTRDRTPPTEAEPDHSTHPESQPDNLSS